MATCFSAPNQSCRTYEGDVLIEHGEFPRVRTVEMNRNIVSRFTGTLAPAPTLFYRNICTWQNCLRGPSAEKTGRGSLLNRPSCSPDDPVGQGIELNWSCTCLDSLTEDLKFLLGLKRNLSVYCSHQFCWRWSIFRITRFRKERKVLLRVLRASWVALAVELLLLSPRSGELRTQKLKSHLVRTQSLNVLPL